MVLDTIQSLRQQRAFKISFLYLLSLFLSFVFWLSIKTNFDLVFLGNAGSKNLIVTFFSLFWFTAFFASFANSISLLKDYRLIFGLILLVNIPYLFAFGISLFVFEGFLILLLCFYIWAKRIKKYDAVHISLTPLRSGLCGMRLAITMFLLIIAFSFYFSVAFRGQASFFIQHLEKYTIGLSHEALKILLPGYNKNLSMEEFISLIVKNKFWQQFTVPNQNLSAPPDQMTNLIKTDLERRLAMNLDNKSADFFVKYFIHDYVTKVLMRYEKLFSPAAAIAFFFFLKIFSAIYFLLIRAFSWVWLRVFLLLGVVQKTKENIEVERIVL